MEQLEQFNNEAENLEILAEECGEIIEILLRVMYVKSKIIRFGLDDNHATFPPNRVRLEQEIGHFNAMVDILIANGTVTQAGIEAGEAHKLENLPSWYGRQGETENAGAMARNLILRLAPHGNDCRPEAGKPCTCWKRDVLALVDSA